MRSRSGAEVSSLCSAVSLAGGRASADVDGRERIADGGGGDTSTVHDDDGGGGAAVYVSGEERGVGGFERVLERGGKAVLEDILGIDAGGTGPRASSAARRQGSMVSTQCSAASLPP